MPECHVNRLNTEKYYSSDKTSPVIRIFRDIHYTDSGLPLFDNEISAKPEDKSGTYHLVIIENGRVVKSIYIGLVIKGDENRDKNPVEIIFHWTGKGFKAGLKISGSMISGGRISSPGEAVGLLVLVAVPIVGGGVGGLFIGILDGTKVALQDLVNLFKGSREYLLGHTDYSYDGMGRLTEYRTYSPDPGEKVIIINAVFTYEGNLKNPKLLKIKNINDKDFKTINIPNP